MNTKARLAAAGATALSVIVLPTALHGQAPEYHVGRGPLPSETLHIGRAEAKRVSAVAYDPTAQPDVYWHDPDWSIDLFIPPNNSDPHSVEPYSLNIRSSTGKSSVVGIPRVYAQVDSISRAPGDKAIVVADCGGTCSGFMIMDLNQGKLIDDIRTFTPHISPDRRFVLYANWFPPHGDSAEWLYHLYDLLKTPRENTCGYESNNPQHQNLDGDMRGFQVYPQKPGQVLCLDLPDEDDGTMGFDFTWAPDSSKVVFATVRDDGIMSLVLVIMPVGAKDLPITSTYALVGENNVCEGLQTCDFHVVQSLGWDGDSVDAVLRRQVDHAWVSKEMKIPVSRFIPIGK